MVKLVVIPFRSGSSATAARMRMNDEDSES